MPPKPAASGEAKFILQCLENSAYTKINWNEVGETSGLKPGTASMRFHRFKAKPENPNMEASFMLLCFKHSDAGKINWKAVGDTLGLKPGAAEMRFRRLKTKLETPKPDDIAASSNTRTPSAPSPLKPMKRKRTTSVKDEDDDSEHDKPDENLEQKVVRKRRNVWIPGVPKKRTDDMDIKAELAGSHTEVASGSDGQEQYQINQLATSATNYNEQSQGLPAMDTTTFEKAAEQSEHSSLPTNGTPGLAEMDGCVDDPKLDIKPASLPQTPTGSRRSTYAQLLGSFHATPRSGSSTLSDQRGWVMEGTISDEDPSSSDISTLPFYGYPDPQDDYCRLSPPPRRGY